MKKTIAVFLSVLLIVSALMIGGVSASAAETGTFTAFSYNVAGLPDISFLSGGESVNVIDNQVCIGKYVSEKQYDIILMSNILEWARRACKDLKIISENLAKLTKKDGIVLCSKVMFRADTLEEEKEAFKDYFEQEIKGDSYVYIKK